jgi:pyrroloquinoline quinone biosynthesis protein B
MALFSDLPAKERGKVWFIHFNHTNPLLDLKSPESLRVIDAGYHIAAEGLRLPL